jgi:membrane-associated HD superfamily phosphohydrolase
MQKKNLIKKYLAVGIILLFIMIEFLPTVYLVQSLNDSQIKFDNNSISCARYIEIGGISDLKIEKFNNSYNYSFTTSNIRIITIMIFLGPYGKAFTFSYEHITHFVGIGYSGFKFRGILTTNFICGVFR